MKFTFLFLTSALILLSFSMSFNLISSKTKKMKPIRNMISKIYRLESKLKRLASIAKKHKNSLKNTSKAPSLLSSSLLTLKTPKNTLKNNKIQQIDFSDFPSVSVNSNNVTPFNPFSNGNRILARESLFLPIPSVDIKSSLQTLDVSMSKLLVCTKQAKVVINSIIDFKQWNASCYEEYTVTVKILEVIKTWDNRVIFNYIISEKNVKALSSVSSTELKTQKSIPFSLFYNSLQSDYDKFDLEYYQTHFESESKEITSFYEQNSIAWAEVSSYFEHVQGSEHFEQVYDDFRNQVTTFESVNEVIDKHAHSDSLLHVQTPNSKLTVNDVNDYRSRDSLDAQRLRTSAAPTSSLRPFAEISQPKTSNDDVMGLMSRLNFIVSQLNSSVEKLELRVDEQERKINSILVKSTPPAFPLYKPKLTPSKFFDSDLSTDDDDENENTDNESSKSAYSPIFKSYPASNNLNDNLPNLYKRSKSLPARVPSSFGRENSPRDNSMPNNFLNEIFGNKPASTQTDSNLNFNSPVPSINPPIFNNGFDRLGRELNSDKPTILARPSVELSKLESSINHSNQDRQRTELDVEPNFTENKSNQLHSLSHFSNADGTQSSKNNISSENWQEGFPFKRVQSMIKDPESSMRFDDHAKVPKKHNTAERKLSDLKLKFKKSIPL